MTCASCGARGGRQLHAVGGGQASVNLATETATVRGDVPVAALIAAVERAGYAANVHDTERADPEHDPRGLLRRLFVSIPLTAVLLLLTMTPLPSTGWLELLLA